MVPLCNLHPIRPLLGDNYYQGWAVPHDPTRAPTRHVDRNVYCILLRFLKKGLPEVKKCPRRPV